MIRSIAFYFVLIGVALASVQDITTTVTATTTSGNCLAFDQSRSSLTLDNTGGTIDVGYCESFPANGADCTAAIGSGGTTTLKAGSLHYWPAGAAPTNKFCFISASSTQAITIKAGH